jgi:hypothetical protein
MVSNATVVSTGSMKSSERSLDDPEAGGAHIYADVLKAKMSQLISFMLGAERIAFLF